MSIELSRTSIDSFHNNVVCLKLLGEKLENADIKWSASNDGVRIRDFKNEGEFSFSDGILLALEKVGETTVTAELDGVKYDCKINIRERKIATDSDTLNYYRGDFHVHTSWDHGFETFKRRDKDFPEDAIRATVADGRLDFSVISDHGSLMSAKDLFRAFWDQDRLDCGDVIIFPGAESEIMYTEVDHFGNIRKPCSEFVTVNATNFIFGDKMEDVERIFAEEKLPIANVAHPGEFASAIGYCFSGFDLYNQQLPIWKKMIRMIETGNGSDRGATLVFEHAYSVALDCGFKVSPCSTSDTHGPVYGFDAMPGKTVFLAPEKSKEMFIDAILNNRVYATESGNTKLHFTVNGYCMGKTIPQTDTYVFHIEIDEFDKSNPTEFVKCEVVSDYGNRVMTFDAFESNTLDFTVTNSTARYFYLRITDSEGRKTYSAPIWTGREFDDYTHRKALKRLDKSQFRTRSADGGDIHAYKITSGNPKEAWYPGTPSAAAIIDMREAKKFCGIEIFAPYDVINQVRSIPGDGATALVREYPTKFRVSISDDGKNFREVANGYVRIFFGYVVEFEECTAQYIKIEFLETVGKTSGIPKHADCNIVIGEVDILTK